MEQKREPEIMKHVYKRSDENRGTKNGRSSCLRRLQFQKMSYKALQENNLKEKLTSRKQNTRRSLTRSGRFRSWCDRLGPRVLRASRAERSVFIGSRPGPRPQNISSKQRITFLRNNHISERKKHISKKKEEVTFILNSHISDSKQKLSFFEKIISSE